MSEFPRRAERQSAFFKQFPRDTGWVESVEEGIRRMERAMPNPRPVLDDEEPRIVATFEEDYQ